MQLTTRSLRSVRVSATVPRAAAAILVVVLALAGLRVVVSGPPAAPAAKVVRAPAAQRDAAAEAFAEGFAREYLTWQPDQEDDRESRLQPYLGAFLEGDGGLTPGSASEQAVAWTAVGGAHRSARGLDVVVAAETSNGRVHLSVPVTRDAKGFLAVADYPALVGPPPTDRKARPRPSTREVDDADLVNVVERAVTNYLAGARDNLLADLTRDAVVSLPEQRLRVVQVGDVSWIRPDRTVAVELEAQDGDGDSWTLRYALEVRRSDRWYVRSLHLDPTTGGM